MPALAAILLSTALLALLCRLDPKRRRAAALPAPQPPGVGRPLFIAAAMLPGVLLITLGDAAGFLLWIGGSAMAGWLLTQLAAARR